MEKKSQLWFACSPFIQVSFLFKQGEEEEKEKKSRYGNYHKPYLFMGC